MYSVSIINNITFVVMFVLSVCAQRPFPSMRYNHVHSMSYRYVYEDHVHSIHEIVYVGELNRKSCGSFHLQWNPVCKGTMIHSQCNPV